MSVTRTGLASHDSTCNVSEGTRQAAVVAGASQATVRTAEIAHYRACKASAVANGVNPSCFVDALYALGTGGL
jgi:hypothetical protein